MIRVGIQAGQVPVPEFINRLIQSLDRQPNVSTQIFGTLRGRNNTNKRVIGYTIQTKTSFTKFLFLLKYFLLLLFFKQKDWRQFHKSYEGKLTTTRLVRYYPLLYHQPDILHVQWAKGIEQFLWVQHFNMKLVLSLRGAHINYSPIADIDLAISYRRAFPKINGFHGVSKAICQEASIYGADLNKCKVVYSGFNLESYPKQNWKNKFDSLATRPINIISVGRSHWKKGYHFSLDAMALLKEKGLGFSYSIVGAAGSEELTFQMNQLGLNEEVNFLDKVPFSTVLNLIGEADVLLLPSVEEGIANVVLEAALLGTIIVTTNCGGMVESVEENKTGFVVEVRNPEQIAEAIVKIKTLNPNILHEIVYSSYNKISSQHNEKKMVSDMVDLYQKVLSQPN